MDDLMVRGNLQGYFLGPTKSILVLSPYNVPQAESLFRGYGLQIVTGSRYLRGFVGTKSAHDSCLGRRWAAGRIRWQPCPRWRVFTRRPHTRACISPSRRNGPSCNASSQTLGWPSRQRWELPGNYPVFTVVMVIYHYIERIWRILVTPVFKYNIYDH